MEPTTNYFYAAYAVFWLLPTIFVIKLFSQVRAMNAKMSELEKKLG